MDNTNAGGGIGLGGAVFIVFLILKLCDVINWSWWWVTIPLWGGIALALGIIAIGLVISLVITMFCGGRG